MESSGKYDDFNAFMKRYWIEKNSHPFLGTQPIAEKGDKVFIMRADYDKITDEVTEERPFPMMALFLAAHPAIKVAETVDEVERLYLGIFDEKVPIQVQDEDSAKFELIRMSSQIAKDCRRGRGNVIVCHPSEYLRVQRLGSNTTSNVKIITRDFVTPRSGYVLYKGNHETDAPGIWAPMPVSGENCYFIDDDLAQKYGQKFYLPKE